MPTVPRAGSYDPRAITALQERFIRNSTLTTAEHLIALRLEILVGELLDRLWLDGGLQVDIGIADAYDGLAATEGEAPV